MNYQKFLEPISVELPCGPDPSVEPALRDKLEELLGRVPKQEFETVKRENGETEWVLKHHVAKEQNWSEFMVECQSVLGRTRHLQAMVLLGLAALNVEGFAALPQTLCLVRESLDKYWETIHPRPTDDDFSDRLWEVNQLSTPDGDDEPDSVAEHELRRDGLFLAQVRVLRGTIPKLVESKLADALGHVTEATKELEKLEKLLQDRLPSKRKDSNLPNFQRLRRLLAELRKELAPSDSPAAASETKAAKGDTFGKPSESPTVLPSIRDQQGVRSYLEALRNYLTASEPSSPVLALVQIAQKLYGKTYLQLHNRSVPEKPDELAKLLTEGICNNLLEVKPPEKEEET